MIEVWIKQFHKQENHFQLKRIWCLIILYEFFTTF